LLVILGEIKFTNNQLQRIEAALAQAREPIAQETAFASYLYEVPTSDVHSWPGKAIIQFLKSSW